MHAGEVDQRTHLAGYCNTPEGAFHKRVGSLDIPAAGRRHTGSGCRTDQEEDPVGVQKPGASDQGGAPKMDAGVARVYSHRTYRSR